ncbi:PREDICTED: proprotein convertase subtilisin/kexin type 9-like [Dipodomys ordii]|uniref:Proprotein convertase subtilisin/kexin type 9-like n=1 Tax=Dipodomys ordii TaxID=10020 RepID=A0A1S3GUA7_DIPOR|nr:PREDICTED: proprotein convertase subtilisin/kexin type 9-like [Dipodomys ordii]
MRNGMRAELVGGDVESVPAALEQGEEEGLEGRAASEAPTPCSCLLCQSPGPQQLVVMKAIIVMVVALVFSIAVGSFTERDDGGYDGDDNGGLGDYEGDGDNSDDDDDNIRTLEEVAYDQRLPNFSHIHMKVRGYSENPHLLLTPELKSGASGGGEGGYHDTQTWVEPAVVVHRSLDQKEQEGTQPSLKAKEKRKDSADTSPDEPEEEEEDLYYGLPDIREDPLPDKEMGFELLKILLSGRDLHFSRLVLVLWSVSPMGSDGCGWPQWPLLSLLLLLLLSPVKVEVQKEWDESGAQDHLDRLKEGLKLARPWEIHGWPSSIIYRRSESAWKVPNTYLVVFKESQRQQMESIVNRLQSQSSSQGLMFEVLHVFKDLFPGILMKSHNLGPRDLDNPVEVYLLGTSIQPNHLEIKGRINISNFERVPDEEWQSTSAPRTQGNCEGNGTYLAALVNGQSVGVAKDINIHSLRVLNCQGKGTVSGILMGLEFLWKKLVSNPSKRMVVLLPLVSGYSQSINNACKSLARAGAVLVAAAGNFQSNACAYSPASSPEVITVGAVDSQIQPLIQGTLGTNYGSCVDIFAPGKNIVSASKDCNVCYVTQSGTSQAAAHVAGIAALMLTAQPNLTVAELRQRLIHYSIRNAINDSWFPEEERFKTPNLLAALPPRTQETGEQLFCRTVWSAPWNITLADTAVAECDPEEELLGCSSFSESGNRQGERVGILGKRRVCLAFGDRQVSAVARCCLLRRANCRVYTAPPALVGLNTYTHCLDPDQVLTGRGPARVTVSCDAGWTLTSCSAHPETSVTLGAFPVDNTCVVRHQNTDERGMASKEFIVVTAICCRIQLSGQP